MTDVAITWRDEQIEMLRDEITRLNRVLAETRQAKILAEERAEAAEARCRLLKEEVVECLPTR